MIAFEHLSRYNISISTSFVMKYTSYILRTLPKKKKLHTFRDLFCALAAAKIDT